MSEDRKALRAFTSWKLDIMDAMSVDLRLTDLDFRVGFRILQHVNSVSKIAWPSVDRLAVQIGRSSDRILAATKHLQQAAWVAKSRRNKRSSNEYVILDSRLNEVIDSLQVRMEQWEEGRLEAAEMQPQKCLEAADLPPVETADLPPVEAADLRPKHLRRTTLEEHLQAGRSEDVRINSSSECSGEDPHEPYPVPETEAELAEMLAEFRAAGFVPAVVGFFRAELMAGRLTPARVEEQRSLAS